MRCKTCALPVPVDALDAQAVCPNCHAAAAIEWTWWREALEAADEQRALDREGSTLESAQPAQLGPPQSPPAFIAQHVRSLRSYAVENAVAAPIAEPQRLACPGCGANLEVDASTGRTTSCRYCSASVVLPDAIWKTLHPIRPPRVLWLRFEGPTPSERMRAAQRAIELRLRREKLESSVRGSGSWIGALVLGAVIAVLAGGFAHSFTVSLGDSIAWVAAYALAFAAALPVTFGGAWWIRRRRLGLLQQVELEQRAIDSLERS